MNLAHLPVFVYGTLQRGEERAGLWPSPPLEVRWATTQGVLYDLGAYPALVAGTDRILGELRSVAPADLPRTLEVLDEVEGFGQQGNPDLYLRETTECVTLCGKSLLAYAYRYANPTDIAAAPRVVAGPNELVHWRRLNQQPPDFGTARR